jgi:predicted permease
MTPRRFLRSLPPGQVRADETEEIHAEIELYLELRTEELVSEGMGREEARRVAEQRFGDAGRIEEELKREARRRRVRREGRMTMDGLRRDLAYSLRTLRRSPGFAVVAIATLGLALGANTAIFSVVDAALLSALPFEDSDELVFVNGYHLVDGQPSVRGASFPEFRDWRERSRAISPMAAVSNMSLTMSGEGEAERLAVEIVTEEYFEVLGAEPTPGRAFVTEEHTETDAHGVAILSHAFFERRFAADPATVGRSIVVNDRPLTIVGVMPAGFGGVNLNTDVWVPESLVTLVGGAGILDSRGSRFLSVVGRLTAGSDAATAQGELDVIALDLQASFPDAHMDRYGQVQSFRDGFLGTTGRLLWLLMGAGLVLLLIASANVASLLLVRSYGRTREIVLRRALGAEGHRVAGQLLTESAVLAALGGVVGLGLALWGLRVLGPMIPQGVLPGYVDVRLSGAAFGYSLVVLALIGFATGLVPAVASWRMDLATKLREGARAVGGGGPRRLMVQHAFVVAQVALALVLMVGAGLLTRSFRAQLAVDTGSELEGILAVSVQLPPSRYADQADLWRFARELEQGISVVPGVVHASLSSDLPFRGGSSASYIFRQGNGPEDRIRYHRHYVTPAYFEALGVDLVAGRYLADSDVDGTAGVVVITEAMARRVYPNESSVGKIMTLRPDGSDAVEIVGVVQDVRYRNLTTSMMAEANSPDVFFSYWQIPSYSLELAVRAQGDPAALVPLLRQAVADIDPALPVFGVQPLRTSYEIQTATPRFAAFLMGLFSTLAVVLACVGVYGVLAFAVGQRSREIAIRRAVGASASSVARSVVGDGLRLVGFGVLLGAFGAVGGGRLLDTFLFEVTATDPTTFVGVGGGMVVVALVAAIVPALRAMRRDPSEALGSE